MSDVLPLPSRVLGVTLSYPEMEKRFCINLARCQTTSSFHSRSIGSLLDRIVRRRKKAEEKSSWHTFIIVVALLSSLRSLIGLPRELDRVRWHCNADGRDSAWNDWDVGLINGRRSEDPDGGGVGVSEFELNRRRRRAVYRKWSGDVNVISSVVLRTRRTRFRLDNSELSTIGVALPCLLFTRPPRVDSCTGREAITA